MYCTVQEIRDRGVTMEAAADAIVQRTIERAEKMVNVYAGRDFLKREAMHRVDGNGTESVFLEDRPVVEILELRVDGYLLSPDSYVLYPEAGYIRLNGARGNIFAGFPGTFPVGSRNVEVHGFFGFEQVPPDVNEAAILLAMEFLRTSPAEADIASGSSASTRNAIGIRRVKIDDISVDFEYPRDLKNGSGRAVTTGLSKVDALLNRHRQWLHPVVL